MNKRDIVKEVLEARHYEGIRDLMAMFTIETDEKERDLIVGDIVDLLKDIKFEKKDD